MGGGSKKAAAPVTVTKEVPQNIQEEDRPISRVNTQAAERATTNTDQSSLLSTDDEEAKRRAALGTG